MRGCVWLLFGAGGGERGWMKDEDGQSGPDVCLGAHCAHHTVWEALFFMWEDLLPQAGSPSHPRRGERER